MRSVQRETSDRSSLAFYVETVAPDEYVDGLYPTRRPLSEC